MSYKPHKLASIFPPMDDETYDGLVDDIRRNGLNEPITLYEDKILDGVHRNRACTAAGVDPRYDDYEGDDAQGFVVSRNLLRRHLTRGQCVDLALKLLPRYEAEAKGRQLAGKADLTSDPTQGSGRAPSAVDRAAKAVGLGATTVTAAKRVKRDDPKLYKDIVAGKISVDAADRKMRKQQGQQPAPKSRGSRSENWNGKTNPKRNRELRERGKTGNYADLVRTQLRINELCSALETTELADFGLDTATLAVVADIHDDLLTLAEWVDRKLHHVGAWLTDVEVRKRISRMRDTRGRFEDEAATALRLADRLERKLETRIPASV